MKGKGGAGPRAKATDVLALTFQRTVPPSSVRTPTRTVGGARGETPLLAQRNPTSLTRPSPGAVSADEVVTLPRQNVRIWVTPGLSALSGPDFCFQVSECPPHSKEAEGGRGMDPSSAGRAVGLAVHRDAGAETRVAGPEWELLHLGVDPGNARE